MNLSFRMGEPAAAKARATKKVTRPDTMSELITPAAAEYAKAKGLGRSVRLAKAIVREIIPSISALTVDVEKDPDEGGYPTICFRITIRESVDSALKQYYTLQRKPFSRVPADDRVHLSFIYHFE